MSFDPASSSCRRLWPALVILGLSAISPLASAQSPVMVSLGSNGLPPANSIGSGGGQPAVTPDGRYVVFAASANWLTSPTVTNSQIYLRDRLTGLTELISQSTSGVASNGTSTGYPSISDDGCRVVFEAWSDNLVGNSGPSSLSHVYVRNRCVQPKTTEMVDVDGAGAPASAGSYYPRISGDGRKVVFDSYANNLVSGLSSGCLYVRDLDLHATTSIVPGICVGGRLADISRDGSRIAFWSYGSWLAADNNGIWDIYVVDRSTPSPTWFLASTSAAGVPQTQGPNGQVWEGSSTLAEPAISADGKVVAFRSRGYGLVPQDTGGIAQIYVKHIDTGAIAVASLSPAGAVGNDHSGNNGSGLRPGLSADGRWVAFTTMASNLDGVPYDVPNAVLRDMAGSGRTIMSNVAVWGTPNVSGWGGYFVAFTTAALDARFTQGGFFLRNFAHAPSAPAITRIIGGNKKVTVHFQPGDTGGSAVTYTARCSGGGQIRTGTATASPVIVTGLVNGTSYSCTVTASNAEGSSAASVAVSRRAGSSLIPILGSLLE